MTKEAAGCASKCSSICGERGSANLYGGLQLFPQWGGGVQGEASGRGNVEVSNLFLTFLDAANHLLLVCHATFTMMQQ